MPRQASVAQTKRRRAPASGARRSTRSQIAPVSRPEISVGGRLRELRNERGLSMRALSERSGLNVNTFSLIENGKTSPSVSTLQQIAAALEVPITAFFETNVPQNSIAHIVARNRPRLAFAHGTLEDLGAGLTSRAVEPFVVTLEPQASSGDNPIVHTGFEFVFCLQGRMTYQIEDHSYGLEPGDSLLFESYLPHRWQNDEAEPAQAILVLYPTDERDHPTERHFAAKGSS
jgi:transcriptional regulator with XRE-family HTH domain